MKTMKTYYKIATRKHEALLILDNPYAMRSKEFSDFDEALAYANRVFSGYSFQILKIEVIHQN
jgi:hypothetical protein